MANHSAAIARGIAQQQAGNVAAAADVYRQILEHDPSCADAWHLLGLALHQQGDSLAAVEPIHRAIALLPRFAMFRNNLGSVLMKLDRRDEAIASFRRAAELDPQSVAAWRNVASAAKATGDVDGALNAYEHLLALDANQPEAHYSVGQLYLQQRRPQQAVASFRAVLQQRPEQLGALLSLAVACWEAGLVSESIEHYEQLLARSPQEIHALVNLANIRQLQGDLNESVRLYRRAIEVNPQMTMAWSNLGVALSSQGQTAAAIDALRQAVRLDATLAEAWFNLGNALVGDDPAEALSCFLQVLQLSPANEAALAGAVHQAQIICDWRQLPELVERLRVVVQQPLDPRATTTASPFAFLTIDPPSTSAEQRHCAERWITRRLAVDTRLRQTFTHRRATTRPDRLKIGYLSADYQTHATAHLIAELFEQHDSRRFEIAAYSYGPADDGEMRRRLIASCARFVDLRELSFAAASQRIYNDGVDILVDLKGYTGGCRPEILAPRPAPVQVNYLGYPGTMGASFIDYIVVDDFIVPADQQAHYAEQVVYLPGCYQVNDRQRPFPPVTLTRRELGLPPTGFVFGALNNNYKITPEAFVVWLRLLREVPGSVLWLLAGNRQAAANLRAAAEQSGIDPARLIFAPRCSIAEHLARHHAIDLFLDTFPVNGHTTTSDALWMGCPVVTRSGETFISRVAGSLLTAIGLPEFVTNNWPDYESLALSLARDPAQLKPLRERLAAARNSCGLFDAARFARHIEAAYDAMWQRHLAGAPGSIRIAE